MRSERRFYSLVTLAFFLSSLVPPSAGAVIGDSPGDSPQGGQVLHSNQISIPAEMGRIEQSYQGPSGKLVILIQDAHAVPDAQRNIQKLIQHFQTEYGVRSVMVEGAASELDPQIFQSFPDKKRLQEVFEDYHQKGELTGATAAAIGLEAGRGKKEEGRKNKNLPSSVFLPPSEFRGAEDWPLYEEGLYFYLAAMSQEAKLLERIKKEEEGVRRKKKEIYSKELLEVDQTLGQFYENKLDLTETLNRLKTIPARPAGGDQRPETKGQKKVNDSHLQSPVFSLRSKSGQSTISTTLWKSDLEVLWKEIESEGQSKATLEIEIKRAAKQIQRLLRKSDDKPIQSLFKDFNTQYQAYSTSQISLSEFALYLKELIKQKSLPISFSSELTQSVQHAKRLSQIEGTKLMAEFEEYSERVMEKLIAKIGDSRWEMGVKTKLQSEISNLQSQTKELRLLKKLAKLELTREEWEKVKNLENRKEKIENRKDSPLSSFSFSSLFSILSSHILFYQNAELRDQAFIKNITTQMDQQKTDVSILISGGFHTQGVSRELTEKGYSFVTVFPQIDSIPEHSLYREHMTGQVSWKDYLKVEDGKIDVYGAFVRAARDRLLTQMNHRLGPQMSTDQKSQRSSVYPSVIDLRIAKQWRDQLIRDLSAQGKIETAGEYTRFIDELSAKPFSAKQRWTDSSFGEDFAQDGEPVEPRMEHGEKNLDSRSALSAMGSAAGFARLARFISGFKQLHQENKITQPAVLQLLKAGTIETFLKAGALQQQPFALDGRFELRDGRLTAKIGDRSQEIGESLAAAHYSRFRSELRGLSETEEQMLSQVNSGLRSTTETILSDPEIAAFKRTMGVHTITDFYKYVWIKLNSRNDKKEKILIIISDDLDYHMPLIAFELLVEGQRDKRVRESVLDLKDPQSEAAPLIAIPYLKAAPELTGWFKNIDWESMLARQSITDLMQIKDYRILIDQEVDGLSEPEKSAFMIGLNSLKKIISDELSLQMVIDLMIEMRQRISKSGYEGASEDFWSITVPTIAPFIKNFIDLSRTIEDLMSSDLRRGSWRNSQVLFHFIQSRPELRIDEKGQSPKEGQDARTELRNNQLRNAELESRNENNSELRTPHSAVETSRSELRSGEYGFSDFKSFIKQYGPFILIVFGIALSIWIYPPYRSAQKSVEQFLKTEVIKDSESNIYYRTIRQDLKNLEASWNSDYSEYKFGYFGQGDAGELHRGPEISWIEWLEAIQMGRPSFLTYTPVKKGRINPALKGKFREEIVQVVGVASNISRDPDLVLQLGRSLTFEDHPVLFTLVEGLIKDIKDGKLKPWQSTPDAKKIYQAIDDCLTGNYGLEPIYKKVDPAEGTIKELNSNKQQDSRPELRNGRSDAKKAGQIKTSLIEYDEKGQSPKEGQDARTELRSQAVSGSKVSSLQLPKTLNLEHQTVTRPERRTKAQGTIGLQDERTVRQKGEIAKNRQLVQDESEFQPGGLTGSVEAQLASIKKPSPAKDQGNRFSSNEHGQEIKFENALNFKRDSHRHESQTQQISGESQENRTLGALSSAHASSLDLQQGSVGWQTRSTDQENVWQDGNNVQMPSRNLFESQGETDFSSSLSSSNHDVSLAQPQKGVKRTREKTVFSRPELRTEQQKISARPIFDQDIHVSRERFIKYEELLRSRPIMKFLKYLASDTPIDLEAWQRNHIEFDYREPGSREPSRLIIEEADPLSLVPFTDVLEEALARHVDLNLLLFHLSNQYRDIMPKAYYDDFVKIVTQPRVRPVSHRPELRNEGRWSEDLDGKEKGGMPLSRFSLKGGFKAGDTLVQIEGGIKTLFQTIQAFVDSPDFRKHLVTQTVNFFIDMLKTAVHFFINSADFGVQRIGVAIHFFINASNFGVQGIGMAIDLLINSADFSKLGIKAAFDALETRSDKLFEELLEIIGHDSGSVSPAYLTVKKTPVSRLANQKRGSTASGVAAARPEMRTDTGHGEGKMGQVKQRSPRTIEEYLAITSQSEDSKASQKLDADFKQIKEQQTLEQWLENNPKFREGYQITIGRPVKDKKAEIIKIPAAQIQSRLTMDLLPGDVVITHRPELRTGENEEFRMQIAELKNNGSDSILQSSLFNHQPATAEQKAEQPAAVSQKYVRLTLGGKRYRFPLTATGFAAKLRDLGITAVRSERFQDDRVVILMPESEEAEKSTRVETSTRGLRRRFSPALELDVNDFRTGASLKTIAVHQLRLIYAAFAAKEQEFVGERVIESTGLTPASPAGRRALVTRAPDHKKFRQELRGTEHFKTQIIIVPSSNPVLANVHPIWTRQNSRMELRANNPETQYRKAWVALGKQVGVSAVELNMSFLGLSLEAGAKRASGLLEAKSHQEGLDVPGDFSRKIQALVRKAPNVAAEKERLRQARKQGNSTNQATRSEMRGIFSKLFPNKTKKTSDPKNNTSNLSKKQSALLEDLQIQAADRDRIEAIIRNPAVLIGTLKKGKITAREINVLIAEDEDGYSQLLAASLREFGVTQIKIVRSAYAFQRAVLMDSPYGLIFLDENMIGETRGSEALKELKDLGWPIGKGTKGPYVIHNSAYNDLRKNTLAEANADRVMGKAFKYVDKQWASIWKDLKHRFESVDSEESRSGPELQQVAGQTFQTLTTKAGANLEDLSYGVVKLNDPEAFIIELQRLLAEAVLQDKSKTKLDTIRLASAYDNESLRLIRLMQNVVQKFQNRKIEISYEVKSGETAETDRIQDAVGPFAASIGRLIATGEGRGKAVDIETATGIKVTTAGSLEAHNIDPKIQGLLPLMQSGAQGYKGKNADVLAIGMDRKGVGEATDLTYFTEQYAEFVKIAIGVASALSGESRERMLERLRTHNLDDLDEDVIALLRAAIYDQTGKPMVSFGDRSIVINGVALSAYLAYRAEMRIKASA